MTIEPPPDRSWVTTSNAYARHRRTDPLCRESGSTWSSRLVLRVALDWTRGRSCKVCSR